MIEIIWILIALNIIGLLVFIGASVIMNRGRRVDYMEKGWTIILAVLGLMVILLAAIPLRFSQTLPSLIFSGFFAVLPLAIFIGKKLPSFKKTKTFAETYYRDKQQRRIAAAIENNDTILLKELIKGQDLSVQGIPLWEMAGLNYLQFAVHLRSNPISFPFDEAGNAAAIRLLVASGSPVTPALAEATRYLTAELVSLLLDAGANPNCRGSVNPNPLLFELAGEDSNRNDMAILLLQRGADANATNDEHCTLVMSLARRSGIRHGWADAWRVVRYLLEEARADYRYTNQKAENFTGMIQRIRAEAADKKIIMPADFTAVAEWLKKEGVDTSPLLPV